MEGPTALFLGLQVASPLLGALFAYARAYHRRVQGVSGHELEADLSRLGFLLSAGLSLAFFWGWPEGSHSWSRMPGLESICHLALGESPQDDPNYLVLKLMLSGLFATTAGFVAKLCAFSLNRKLVKQVPRYFRAEDPVGKR